MKQPQFETLILDTIISGGQAIGKLDNGKKALVWGGLPGEKVEIQVTKKKSSYIEGIVTHIIEKSHDRIEPVDENSYLSTSPWQIMSFDSEQHYKAALIEEAFELHNIVLPNSIDIYTNEIDYRYRNKMEFSWWWDKENNNLDLAFFRRGTHNKVAVTNSGLADPSINRAAQAIRDLLRKKQAHAYDLKTVIIRCSQNGDVSMQLYVKDIAFDSFSDIELSSLGVKGFELIFSNPKSPASVITKRIQSWGETSLTDNILDIPFTYAVEGFFQINIPIYEQALKDIKPFIDADNPVVDLYSGVGTIGLTIGNNFTTLVEINEYAVSEMKKNIKSLGKENSTNVILAPSENALDNITKNATIIVDPPRAGLHENVIEKILQEKPSRIVYLSCNPVTQARDVKRLGEVYGIRYHRGYNFFPRTPHIEHLVILDLKSDFSKIS